MRISHINFNNPINFGYDKNFHKSLQMKLSESNNPNGLFLAKIDRNLIKEENKILLLEKLGLEETKKYQELCDSLVRARVRHALSVDEFSCKNKCCENLSKIYRLEASNATKPTCKNWRKKLSALIERESSARKDEYKKQILRLVEDTSAPASKAKSGALSKNDDISSLIPLYVAGEHSPKSLLDVVGSQDIKDKLKDDLIPYMVSSEQIEKDFVEYGIRAPRGFLFYGPPGCGKTFITQALAAETGIPMYTMDISKVGAMWVNKTSNNIRDAFEYIFAKAKETDKPIILFMDEVDSMAMSRNSSATGSKEDAKSLTTLLKMVENARDNNVLVIAATNRYDILDAAFKDRFDSQIYFPLPDEEQIENLLTSSLFSRKKGETLGHDEEKIKELSKMLKGYSNRAIIQIIDDSAKFARKRSRDDITFDDVKKAIEETDHEKIKDSIYKQEDKRTKIGF